MPREADTGAQRAPVGIHGEEVLPDARRLRRIGRGELDAAAAFGPYQHHHAREGVDEGLQQIRAGSERRALEEKLDVRHRPRGVCLHERDQRSGQIRGEAPAEEIALGELERDAVVAHMPVKRAGLFAPVRQRRHHMVLQVFPHAWRSEPHIDPVRAQMVRIANAGEHQEVRRIDDAAREQQLAFGAGDALLSALLVFDAGRAAVLEHDARRMRAHFHAQVGAAKRRPQISVGGAAAAAVANRHLHAGEAVLLGAVVIVGDRVARGDARVEPGVEERIGIARAARGERPAAAAIRARAVFPRFLAPEIRQRVRIRPAWQAVRVGPALVIGAIAAHVRHGVDRRAAAHHLAARALDRAAADAFLRLGEIAPVVQPIREDAAPRKRNAQPRIAIPPACLQQQHADVRILGEAIGKHAARRARPDDHIVEFRTTYRIYAAVAFLNASRLAIAASQRLTLASSGSSTPKRRHR